MTDADFDACSLWPIIVDFGEGNAYSLWGSGGGDDDLILAVGDRLRGFRRWPRLVDWVLEGNNCNLSGLAGYATFQNMLESPGQRVPEQPKRYPFAEVRRWLAEGSQTDWTASRASTTLDCLNLLWDAARSVGAATVGAKLRRGAEPLGSLMDAFTFADDEERRELASLPWSRIVDAYDDVRNEIAARWDIE